MAGTTVSIGDIPYKMLATSEGGHELTCDEPAELGGGNEGFSPDELFCASLGACTAATLRMYADRKGWPLEEVKVSVSFDRKASASATHLLRQITFVGKLDVEQRQRLLEIANKCPMHKTLMNPIDIETVIE